MRQIVRVLQVFFLASALLGSAGARAQEIISVDSFSFNGSGCTPGSVSYNLSTDRLALTLLFANFAVSTDSVAVKSCAVDVALRVPPGGQYALFSLDAPHAGRSSLGCSYLNALA